jgi:hypothetical protein
VRLEIVALGEFLSGASLERLELAQVVPRVVTVERIERIEGPVAPITRHLRLGKPLAHAMFPVSPAN